MRRAMAGFRSTRQSGWRCWRAVHWPVWPACWKRPGRLGAWCQSFPTNYGFTAIIVAFLGRLHPIGIIFAGLAMAIAVVGGEVAQTTIKLPVRRWAFSRP